MCFMLGKKLLNIKNILSLKKKKSPVNFLVLLRNIETGVNDISKRITPV